MCSPFIAEPASEFTGTTPTLVSLAQFLESNISYCSAAAKVDSVTISLSLFWYVCKTSKHYNINNETSCIQDCDNSRHSKEESCKYSKDWKKIATNSSKALLKTGLNAASTVSGVGKAAGAGAKAIKAAEALEAGGKLTKVYKAVKTANDLGLID